MNQFPSLLSFLQTDKLVTLPGNIDKNGRPIFLVVIPQDTNSTPSDITAPLKYLVSIFSDSTRNRGFTIILDARKGSWKVSRTYIKQCIETFVEGELKQLILIKPDGFWDKQKVESCLGAEEVQEVVFISKSRLTKFVEPSQIPKDLGGALIYDHENWLENRKRVEEFYNDGELTLKELEDLQKHMISSKTLRASQIEEAINTSSDMEEATRMLVNNAIETGKELVQSIEYENRTRKLSIDQIDKNFTPQDTLDTIEKIHDIVNKIRQKQQDVEHYWIEMEKSFFDTKDLNELKKRVVKVTNWILGPGEKLMKCNQKVGYDVSSAEELRREHEGIELQCWESYGSYAEILHKIGRMDKNTTEKVQSQIKDLISQKEFMDFVCKSFALRLEKRRNVLITSLRFFRLVSEYFDKTGDVFESLVMESDITDFNKSSERLAQLEDSQQYLELVAQEIKREGEKLSDMLSMPIKDALGQEIQADYSEDIVNIHDVIDATVARKNIFSDSVELQKLTLQQITLIDRYEKDSEQAIKWLDDILKVMLRDHGHVGSSVNEIQTQKEQHQVFQETSKCTYNYGCQLLNASLQLRQSCKLPFESHNKMYHRLKRNWQRIHAISQEQMTRLRVSAVFHRSVEEHCNQLRDLREAVATIAILCLTKRKVKVQQYFEDREKLMVEVGRMVRLGRLLRSRLKESLYEEESFFAPISLLVNPEDEFQTLCHASIKNNETSIESITEKLLEVTQLSEELDQTLKSAQQDFIVFSNTSASTSISTVPEINNNIIMEKDRLLFLGKPIKAAEDHVRSDEEFLTASDSTLQHSRSSSYNTASECEQHFSSWWQHGSDDRRGNISKEKMVLAVGCPPEGNLPPASEVLKSSPEVPPGKIAREVTETTHIKVQQQHNFGVKSFVLTSEIVRDNDSQGSSREETLRYCTGDGKEITVKVEKADKPMNPEELLSKINEVGVLECDNNNAWSNYNCYSYRNVNQETIKKFMLS